METNPLIFPHSEEPCVEQSDFDDPMLQTITRIRLLSDPGCPFWDVSYIHGRLKDGTKVRVIAPAHWFQIPKSEGPVRWILRTTPQIRKLCFVKDVLSLCQ